MPASAITYAIEADFDGDGVYETDLTPYINARTNGWNLFRGMSKQGVYQSASLDLELDNVSGLFTPENSGGTLYGLLEPDTAIRVKATHAATPHTLGILYSQEPTLEWWADRPGGIATYICADLADYLRKFGAVNVVSSTSRDSDAAITAILDAMSIAAGLRSLDDGIQAFPFHFVPGQDAMAAIMDCVTSEMGGRLYVNKSGQIRFESRAARLGLTVDRTWGDGTNIIPEYIKYETNESDIIGQVEVQATVFQSDQLQQEVFRFSRGSHNNPADSLFLTSGREYEADFYYDSAVLALAQPVASEDYLANASQDGSGADRTGNLTVTVTDKGGRGTVKLVPTADLYVTALRVLATTETFLNDRPIFISAKSTPRGPTDGVVTFQVPWADDTGLVARDYSMALLRINRYPTPRLTLRYSLERHNDIAASLLATEISDLILYSDVAKGVTDGAMVNDWFYVESIGYAAAVGKITKATVTLVPTYAFRDLDKITYDLFTRADASGDLGTSLSGDTWLNDSAWDIASNKAQAQAGAVDRLAWVELSAANAVVETTLEGMSTAAAGAKLGLCFRVVDTNNYWRVYLVKNTNSLDIEYLVAGVVSYADSVPVTLAASHEVQVIMQGSRVRVRLDRKWVFDTSDTTHSTATKHGLYANNVTAGRVHDDFYAQGL